MAKLRHIAIAAEDPYATAEFFKAAFDFVEVHRTQPTGEGKSYGVFLSDGTINMAILHFGWDQGHGLDYRGIHHLGVLVDDVDAYTEKLEKLGADVLRETAGRTRKVSTRRNSTGRTRSSSTSPIIPGKARRRSMRQRRPVAEGAREPIHEDAECRRNRSAAIQAKRKRGAPRSAPFAYGRDDTGSEAYAE